MPQSNDGVSFRRNRGAGPGADHIPAFSLDGSLVYFQSDRSGNLDIWVANADGTGVPALLTTYSGNDRDPFVHSDGRILFHSSPSGPTKSWVMNSERTGARQVSDAPAGSDQRPTSGNDGWVYFDSSRPGSHNEVYQARVDGDNTTEQVANFGFNTLTPAVSPDGAILTHGSNRAGSSDVWAIRTDRPAEDFQLTTWAFSEGVPAFAWE